MGESTHDGLSVTIIILAYVISLPIILYCAYKLYRNWEQCYMLKRYRLLLVLIIIGYSIIAFIEIPFDAIALLSDVPWGGEEFMYVEMVGWECRFIICSLVTMRMYLLHYDHEYQRILYKRKWNIMTDPTISENWYLKNRKSLGDPAFLFKSILISVYIIAALVVLLVLGTYEYSPLQMTGGFGVIVFISFAICLYYWSSFPKMHDHLHIRDELLLFIVIYYTMFACTAILISIGHYGYGGDVDAQETIFLIALILTQLFIILDICVMILYPEWKVNQENSPEMMILNSQNDVKRGAITWETIIETNEGYEAFANFLMTEFSMENLLFVTEVVQLKNGIRTVDDLRLILDQRASELSYNLNLPAAAPKCIKLRGANKDKEMKEHEKKRRYLESTVKLYLKYIDPEDAYLEVNLSSKIKKDLISEFKQLNLTLEPFERVLPFLDEAAIDIGKLMRDSFGRFRATEQFRKLDIQRPRDMSSTS